MEGCCEITDSYCQGVKDGTVRGRVQQGQMWMVIEQTQMSCGGDSN